MLDFLSTLQKNSAFISQAVLPLVLMILKNALKLSLHRYFKKIERGIIKTLFRNQRGYQKDAAADTG